MCTRAILFASLLIIAVHSQTSTDACPVTSYCANIVAPCSVAKCAAFPTATCVPDPCRPCSYYFVDEKGVKVDCSNCEGKCLPVDFPIAKPVACVDPTATPFYACVKSADNTCTWRWQCSGTCCLAEHSLSCNASSTYNGDWCPEGSTCCLTNDVIGEAIHSFSCCPPGSQCKPTGQRGAPNSCVPIDPCASMLCNDSAPVCVVVGGVATCQPIVDTTNPCAVSPCLSGICRAVDGKATCVKPEKSGTCPLNTGTVGVCGGGKICLNDWDCDLDNKCCNNGCGPLCTPPVKPTVVKPGTCPNEIATLVACTGLRYDLCTVDGDCEGNLKCCRSGDGCRLSCVLPKENVCTECPPMRIALAPRDCGDGTFAHYECNKETCSWEYKDCECVCDYTTFAAKSATEPASTLLPTGAATTTTQLPSCLVATSTYSADAKEMTTASFTGSGSTTTTTATATGSILQSCFGKGGCERIGGKCVPSWTCQDCLPSPPLQRCERAGCQNEKCVAPGSAITMECALPSQELECRKQAICDVDASGTCAWNYDTEGYRTCMGTPPTESPKCSSLDACTCATNTDCLWCLSDLRVKPDSTSLIPITIPIGKCILKKDSSLCLAPKSVGGLEGTMVDTFTCDPKRVPDVDDTFRKLLEKTSTVQVNTLIADKLKADNDVSGYKVLVHSVLPPEKRSVTNSADDGKGGIVRAILAVDPKPTPDKLTRICAHVTSSMLGSSYDVKTCVMSEIVDSGSAGAAGGLKRQGSSSQPYLYQGEAQSQNTAPSQTSIGIIIGVVSAAVVLIAVIIVIVVVVRSRTNDNELQ